MRSPKEIAHRFAETYARPESPALEAIQREIFGADAWVRGYTTIAQADLLGRRLGLKPGVLLLDLGCGQGWPSVRLAAATGCSVIMSDVPRGATAAAAAQARREGVQALCSFLQASATHLPFREGAFDAVLHTDTL